MGKNQFVVKSGAGWGVRGAGNSKLTSVHPTQKAAIGKATAIARRQQSEVTIQGRDGKFREKNSYGNDPQNIPG